jgi:hypothetical protein
LWWRECAQPDLSGQLVLTVVLTVDGPSSVPSLGVPSQNERPLTLQVAQPTKSWLVSWPMSMAKVCRPERLLWCPHVVMRWSVRGQGPVYFFGVVCCSRMLWRVNHCDMFGQTFRDTLVLGSDRCGCSGPTASRVASGCQRQLARGSVSKISQNPWTYPT